MGELTDSERLSIETKGTALLFIAAAKILEKDRRIVDGATIWVTHKSSAEFSEERTRTPDDGVIVGDFSQCRTWFIGYAPRVANQYVDEETDGDIPAPPSEHVRLILLFDGENEVCMDVPLDVALSVGGELDQQLKDESKFHVNAVGGVA